MPFKTLLLIINFLLLLTFNAFAHNKPLNKNQIVSYFKENGEKEFTIIPVSTLGATECSYFIAEYADGKKKFIKTGEKVDLEVKNLNLLQPFNLTSIPLMYKESSHNILISEYLNYPHAGNDAVNKLYNDFNLNEFIEFQEKVFLALKELYDIQVNNKSSKTRMFKDRAEERIKDLIKDNTIHKLGLSLKEIVETDIIYNHHNYIPSIEKMTKNVISILNDLPEVNNKRVIHGDFHPPNITMDINYNIKLIDLSDIKYNEDPSWDLGKWLNFIKRFHWVVKLRSDKYSSNENYNHLKENIRVNFKDNKFFVSDSYVKPNVIKYINDKAIEKFAEITKEDKYLIEIRSAAAEYIVNLSTLKRHLHHYPETFEIVLYCVIDSYLNFIEKWNEYKKQTNRKYFNR
ncbi:MAG: hypothetical protein J0H68_04840 [Sphingobacteriia bacterium]|nr:hypothetical protein [Sphingobacteriia bacterium]